MVSMIPTTKILLFDTTVFIDYLRGKDVARGLMNPVIDKQREAAISVISDFELWCGVKDIKDEKRHKLLIWNFRRFQLNSTIARHAGELARPFFKEKNKSIGMSDFLIAATAEYYEADILTRNPKHFNAIPLDGVHIFEYSI